jgi:fluoride ion exporter CrcB/FEX
MTKERGFLAKLFCEGNEPSSKRFVGILGSLTLFGTLFANSFSHLDHAPSEALVNAVALLSFGALGITGAEKIFSKKTNKE